MPRRNIDRYSADSLSHDRLTIDRLSTDCRPTIDCYIDQVSTDYRPLYRSIDRSTLPTVNKITFLQLRVTKTSLSCAVKTVFSLTPSNFLRAPDNSNYFWFPLKVRIIGNRLYYYVMSLVFTRCFCYWALLHLFLFLFFFLNRNAKGNAKLRPKYK